MLTEVTTFVKRTNDETEKLIRRYYRLDMIIEASFDGI